ncbi:MAG: hypothetical protein A3H97_11960 [Acidobacteria bacterium RIFCSPLOWO2_02_FULL_65_29]|nr:MAG: hypothetical protein A3H97_11960 [Acidobacteria bacterium RIFCSPLOWO2_02_FULL_65_29]
MLELFKSLPLAREVHRADALPARALGYVRDTIALGWEERVRARARRTSNGGVEFGTALERGTVLRGGDCLVIDDRAVVVSVVECDEPVFVITPRSRAEWGLYAYQIGNNHQPLMIAGDEIVCPAVPGLEQLLEQCGIQFARASRPFTPVAMLADHRHG